MTDPVHAVHKLNDNGVSTVCGLMWWRGTEPKIEATAQWADVTCEECRNAARKTE